MSKGGVAFYGEMSIIKAEVLCAILVVSAASGCAALAGERSHSNLEMSLQRQSGEKPAVRFWISEASLTGSDGLRSAGVVAIAGELVDLVNQAYVNRLRSHSEGAVAFELDVPPQQLFGSPITLPPSPTLNPDEIRSAVYGSFPPRGEFTMAVRHRIEYNVFSDSVEMQLLTVVTVLQPNGMPYWQTAARSQKFYDNWGNGEQLAALSAHFAALAVRENVTQLVRSPRFVQGVR